MRRVIAAMQISADGYIEDREGTQDWVENWDEDYGLPAHVDTCVLGSGMYDGYQQYWRSMLANPNAPLALTGKKPTPKEIEYAKWADRTPHLLVSRRPLNPTWKNTRVVADLAEIRRIAREPGKDIYVIGGATLISSMIEDGLIDELRLVIHPVLLGGGKLLFAGVRSRHRMRLLSAKRVEEDRVYVVFTLPSVTATAAT